MSYERFIGLRYLMAKKRSQVVSIITLISVVGVALGVTALIVVLSVMGGFKKDLEDKILGTKAHVVVEAAGDGDLTDAWEVSERVEQVEGVVGAEPFLEAELMVSSPTNLSGLILRGIDPDRVGDVSELPQALAEGEGELSYLEDPAPLLEKLEEQRDRDIDEILDRIGGDDEDDHVRRPDSGSDLNPQVPPPPGQGESQGQQMEPPTFDGGDATADDEQAGDAPEEGGDEEIMPPLVDEEDDAEAEDEGAMPPIFDDEDAGEDDSGDSVMPPIFEEGDSGEDGAGAKESRLPGLLIGPELARSLQVDLGDEVNVVTPEGDMGPTGKMPRSRPFRIVGIFHTGMYEYDANYAYTTFSDASAFLNRDGASGVDIKTVDPDEALDIADELEAMLGDDYEVLDWQEMNRSLFFALELEKIAMFVVLTFIILVASFSIIAMLIMIVIEKARDIAVLKSMGVTDKGVRRIFEIQGLVIGGVGALSGLVLGLGICAYLSLYGVPLDSEVYYISTLPVEVNPWEVGAVIVCALVISWAATVYPAYLAANLQPVDGLRYD